MTNTALHARVDSQARLVLSPTNPAQNGKNDDKQVTLTELMAAFALFKAVINKGAVDQSKTMSNLFVAQDKSLELSKQKMEKIISSMGSIGGEQTASKWLGIAGAILGVIGMVCMFIPGLEPLGAVLMIGSGACLIASGGLQIDMGVKMKKIAEQKGDMMKDMAVEKQAQSSVSGLSTQLNNTMSSKSSLEQTINAIIRSYGEASRSAAPQQRNYGQAS